MGAHFTEGTTGYWQRLVDASAHHPGPAPWRLAYPARLPDGRLLMLPIRQFVDEPDRAVASLLLEQAALDVMQALGATLAAQLERYPADAVVGLPPTGLPIAAIVARELGHARYIPVDGTRRFWYDEALSMPVLPAAAPGAGKRLYLDPNLLPLVAGKRVILVDDIVRTGSTLEAGWELLELLGAKVVACGVVLRQGRRWMEKLGAERSARLTGVLDSPLLQAVPEGWVPRV